MAQRFNRLPPEAPYAGGNQARLKLEGQKTIVSDLRLTGLFGHASRASRPDYDYWEFGVEKKDWRKFTFMLGRTGSNQKSETCLDPDWCRDAWIGSVTLRSY